MFEIIIKDLRLFGYHGVNSYEKEEGQDFIFNIKIILDKYKLGEDGSYIDDIKNTVSYSDIIRLIKKINGSASYDLLETLSRAISEEIIKYSGNIVSAEVRVEKPVPPIKENLKSVGVSFKAERKRICDGECGERFLKFYISAGSNVGDRQKNLIKAVEKLSNNSLVNIIKISSIYETGPMYLKEQDNFYNIVLKGIVRDTRMTDIEQNAFEFLGFLKSIEYLMGRAQGGSRNGPRIIDLDLLYFEGLMIDSDILSLPHPKTNERKFVLLPLSEIEPGFMIGNAKIRKFIDDADFVEKVFKLKAWEF